MISKVIIVAALAVVSLAQNYGVPSGYGRLDDYKYPPQPYDAGYQTDDGYGTTTFRKESGDGNGIVQGTYGYRDNKGLERVVDYVADDKGFRAQVKTNEPGTESQNPADVLMLANPVVVDYAQQRYTAAPQASYSAPLGPAYSAPRSAYAAPRLADLRLPYGVVNPSYGVNRVSLAASRASAVTSRAALIPSSGVTRRPVSALY